jgi:hypothetical protein
MSAILALSTENAVLRTQVAEIVRTEAAQATRIASQEKAISHIATKMFAPLITPVSSMPTPSRPVLGSVVIEGGRCCAGGVAGETIYVTVDFEAMSPFAEVTEMKVRVGGLQFDEEQMAEVTWEPLVASKSYPVYVAINWTGFHVTVQYKDAQGNLSVVYSDDISIEGHPEYTPQ